MKIIIIIFITTFALQLNAQVPGYMGKRFSVFISPGISMPHLSKAYSSVLTPRFGYNGGVSFDYITSENVALGLRYKLAYNTSENNPDYFFLSDYIRTNKFYSHSFGPFIKIYSRRTLAPISTYVKFGFQFQVLQRKNIILSLNNTAPSFPFSTPINYSNQTVFDAGLNIGVGKNWIIGDFLLLGFETEAGLPFISHAHNFFSFNGFGSTDFDGEEEVIYRTNFANEIFKVSLNVGFLAF